MARGIYVIRRARKVHKCSECSWRIIAAGDLYLYGAGAPEADWNSSGKWYIIRACLRCANSEGLHTSETRAKLAGLSNGTRTAAVA